MDNVYDRIDDFYDNDPEWNTVLHREYAEGFLRREAWSGLVGSQLEDEWDYLLMLCLYLGNADLMLGDMTQEDVIDAIAWCGRNIADFKLSYRSVSDYLAVLSRLFQYLQAKKVITSVKAPQLAAAKLLDKEKQRLLLITPTGEYLEEAQAYYRAPEATAKVFLNMGGAIGLLLERLHRFFQREEYNYDLERAVFLYHGFYIQGELQLEEENECFWQSFWDYFLFDYHLLANDLTPLEHFARSTTWQEQEQSLQALVEELQQVKLAVFTVKESVKNGFFVCQDFLTQEEYLLSLPFEPDFEWEDLLIIAHIFYNKSMVMNYLRCLQLDKLERKRLYNALEQAVERFKVQEREAQEEDFIRRNSIVVRRMLYSYKECADVARLSLKKDWAAYQPAPATAATASVTKYIRSFLQDQHFSARDMQLATQLWQDFAQKEPDCTAIPADMAAGIIAEYIKINGAYNYTLGEIAGMCHGANPTQLERVAIHVHAALELEKYDPRYCNEEGFLMLLFSK